jgi:hypothetical protein
MFAYWICRIKRLTSVTYKLNINKDNQNADWRKSLSDALFAQWQQHSMSHELTLPQALQHTTTWSAFLEDFVDDQMCDNFQIV